LRIAKKDAAMKSLIAMICLAVAGAAWAQGPKPQPEAPKPAASQTEKPAVQASAKPRKPNPKRSEDARHCLEKSSSTEVIKCAEEYL
jgi:outer membrane biosynthesis protein TonB